MYSRHTWQPSSDVQPIAQMDHAGELAEEILLVLALAGTLVFGLALPIAGAIAALLVVLTISYRQTIFAYPNGGGAYIVARDNLGTGVAQVAGAALLTDYVLTVSVSIASGVAQITSALPALRPFQVEICLVMIVLITVANLRGVKESGRIFAGPTYFFIGMTLLMLGIGFIELLAGALPTVQGRTVVPDGSIQPLTMFLILRAFSSGCTALTGVEAISNGIPAFAEPKSRNAATTILIMAANTSFADFPRLCALIAGDGYLPRQLTWRGRRLVFSWGILVLAALASLLLIIFQGDTHLLIPLYAIGVFLSFTLSQAGMVRHWQRTSALAPGEAHETHDTLLRFEPQWRLKLGVNAVGCILTACITGIFAVTKFQEGAWIVVILIPQWSAV